MTQTPEDYEGKKTKLSAVEEGHCLENDSIGCGMKELNEDAFLPVRSLCVARKEIKKKRSKCYPKDDIYGC